MTRSPKIRLARTGFVLWCGCALLAFTSLLTPVAKAEGIVTEEVAKALALSKVGDYVKKWPDTAFADTNSPVVIGVLGRNLFATELEQFVKIANESATGRKVVVRQLKDTEPMEHCQMLFVAASEKSRMSQILQKMEGKGILTISDLDGFVTRHGGCLRLFVEDKALKFDVNQTALDREQISFNSGFLGLKGTRRIRDGKVVK